MPRSRRKAQDWNVIAVHGGYKKFVFCLSVTPHNSEPRYTKIRKLKVTISFCKVIYGLCSCFKLDESFK